MYFDGAAHNGGASTGVEFITSHEYMLPFTFTLNRCCFNNDIEYQPLTNELHLAVDMKQLHLKVSGDS